MRCAPHWLETIMSQCGLSAAACRSVIRDLFDVQRIRRQACCTARGISVDPRRRVHDVVGADASARRYSGHTHEPAAACAGRSEEHTSELQSLMRISYAVFCLKKKKKKNTKENTG